MFKIKQFLNKILTYNKFVEIYTRTKPLTMLTYEVHLVDHCNLKCKGCLHFSPLCEENFTDVIEYEKDCSRLSKLFDKEASSIKLLGGEPLLHPEITKFLEITRKYFPDAIIQVVSNGILATSMSNHFWESMHDNNIELVISKYPIEVDYKKIQDICNKNDVTFIFADHRIKNLKNFSKYPLDLSGKQNIEENFLKCACLNYGNSVITLKNGKLYTCPTIAYSEHFNKSFNTDLKISKKDYIDIYQAESDQEILEFLAKPKPFCRYCNVNCRQVECLKWELSKKDISEWT